MIVCFAVLLAFFRLKISLRSAMPAHGWLRLLGCAIMLAAWLPIGGSKRISSAKARFWAEFCLRSCSLGKFDKGTTLSKQLMTLHSVSDEIKASVKVRSCIQNSIGSLHCGAAAALVDEVTTAAIMAKRCYPGVSVALSMQHIQNCQPDEVIFISARVTRLGQTLAYTEATIYRADNTPMLKGTHVKYIVCPWIWSPIFSARPVIADALLKLAGARLPSLPALVLANTTIAASPEKADEGSDRGVDRVLTLASGVMQSSPFGKALFKVHITIISLITNRYYPLKVDTRPLGNAYGGYLECIFNL
jgi:acyl-coenzyme A thioesterase PaaI-like protein